MKNRILFSTFTFFLVNSLFSQYKQTELYPGINGNALLNELFNNYKPNLVLNYTDARIKMYKEIYNVNDTVHCVYTRHALYLDPNFPNPIDYLAKAGSANGINCEHTFPQSKGAEIGNARSDMHHLFPSRWAVNEARSNFPYSEIDDSKTKKWFYLSTELNSKPNSLIDEYSENITGLFEPREDHKGNAARAIFYFMTMYDIQADRAFFDTMKNTLCQWHIKDPVDSLEWHRSYAIAKYQDNKANPYVLDCSLAKRTYCSASTVCNLASANNLAINSFKLSPNPATEQLLISIDDDLIIKSITIYNNLGLYTSLSNEEINSRSVNLAHYIPGIYFIKIQLKDGNSFTHKLIIQR